MTKPRRYLPLENHRSLAAELSEIKAKVETIFEEIGEIYGHASFEAVAFEIVLRRLERAQGKLAKRLSVEHSIDLEVAAEQVYRVHQHHAEDEDEETVR